MQRDACINTTACDTDQDRNTRFVRSAHEAYALKGKTSHVTYLVPEEILAITKREGTNAIHPGYGFLSENPKLAQTVINASLMWNSPHPLRLDCRETKFPPAFEHRNVGPPLVLGAPGPVTSADEVVAFTKKHGIPVSTKSAHGGRSRGLKVVDTLEEFPEQFDSPTRGALAAFRREEYFGEECLEKPRHVETQCLAGANGNVVVVSTRDCSSQRRHQKPVEEGPAPFLSEAQKKILYDSTKALFAKTGYVGARTGMVLNDKDGTISFLEVNARLQVEHPVSDKTPE